VSPSTYLTRNLFLYIAIVETPSAWRIADRRYVYDTNDYVDYIWWNSHTEGRPIAEQRKAQNRLHTCILRSEFEIAIPALEWPKTLKTFILFKPTHSLFLKHTHIHI